MISRFVAIALWAGALFWTYSYWRDLNDRLLMADLETRVAIDAAREWKRVALGAGRCEPAGVGFRP